MINSQKMQFRCALCGRFFGRDVIGLGRHMGDEHDQNRGQNLQ